jgi:hypothetical protein
VSKGVYVAVITLVPTPIRVTVVPEIVATDDVADE